MRYFSVTEWLKDARTSDLDILRKIEWWISILTPVREALGEQIVITHGLRKGDGTSQHFFKQMGASDLRVSVATDDYEGSMIKLAKLLVPVPEIKRICFYPKGDLFPNGGFHTDSKTHDKFLYISDPDKVNWVQYSETDFIENIKL